MDMNIGHISKTQKRIESLYQHLKWTSILSRRYCRKIGLGDLGEFVGFVHDIGKADLAFTAYIMQSNGILPPELYEYRNQYKNDHSTLSGQYINRLEIPMLQKKIMAEVCMSHHSGLINYICDDGSNQPNYEKRIKKDVDYERVMSSLDSEIASQIDVLLKEGNFAEEFRQVCGDIQRSIVSESDKRGRRFMQAMLTKYIFSCLCDADRNATAAFMGGKNYEDGLSPKTDWEHLSRLLENHISKLENETLINTIRSEISNRCLEASNNDKGRIFILNVPTGGGKTLSTLRFALNHIKQNDMDRVIYVLPYTSIIEQNAQVAREILDENGDNNVVLECHSNLLIERETEIETEREIERTKLLSQSWNAPVIFTTMVQFLESIFSGNIRSNRRMHNLANSVIIFDEVQCVPSKCIYMFNEFIRFITGIGRSSVVLCTATQPLLDNIPEDVRGVDRSLEIGEETRIITEEIKLAERLQRVELIDKRKISKWTNEEVVDLALNQDVGSVLIIVNTKACANSLYEKIRYADDCDVVYLSTNMYPEHRKKVIKNLKDNLATKTKKIVCVSTQLIEAGVDIDFDCVIRSLAGLDSIAQAAGRCNRNGLMKGFGKVYIVNMKAENLSRLQDIKRGQQAAIRVLDMYKRSPVKFSNNLLCHKAISKYFEFLYCDLHGTNAKHFEYNSKDTDNTIFELLSMNEKNVRQYIRVNGTTFSPEMTQAFMTAGKSFKVIDSTARGVIVQKEGGAEIINDLIGEENPQKLSVLLQQAQKYSINIFPFAFDSLLNNGIYKISEDLDVYYLSESLYDKFVGLCNGRNNFLSIG